MKNSTRFILLLAIVFSVSVGCNKIKATFFNEYKKSGCQIEGDNELQTTDDYIRHGTSHLNKDSTKEYECAFYACNQAVMMDSNSAEAYSCRGIANYLYRKDYKSAIADLDTSIKLQPISKHYEQRAIVNEYENKQEESIADLEKAYQLNIDLAAKANNKFNIARIQFKKNQVETALANINEAIALKPDSSRFYDLRTDIYRELGKKDLAETDARKVEELNLAKEGKTPSPPPVTADINITNQPKANYTNQARQNQVQGMITLQVTFLANGQIGNISAINNLPFGLTEQAIAAAKNIRFEPARKNGVTYTVTKQIQYNFTLY